MKSKMLNNQEIIRMGKIIRYDGRDLLDRILQLSDESGRMRIDVDTLLPDATKYPGKESCVNELIALMKAFGIVPSKDDFDEEDLVEGLLDEKYLKCFVDNEFSEESEAMVKKLLMRYLAGEEDENTSDLISMSLRDRDSRWQVLKNFLLYVQRLKQWECCFAGESGIFPPEELFMVMLITELTFDKRIMPIVEIYKDVMVLLMGDYAERSFCKEDLISHFGYPKTPLRAIYGEDIPFL